MATSDAQDRLSELKQHLDEKAIAALADTSTSLARKKANLEEFTVTLFGRTMAGKSTIREAITGGDGSTIGKGGQNTTCDVKEYKWDHLRVIDTPGIGSYKGDEYRKKALSVIDESDVLLFLASSDSIQESSFQGMQKLRDQNKPVIFVLNIKLDLTPPVIMRRFLRSPELVMGEKAIRGHVLRIHRLASDKLGMRNVVVVPIHAQAAFLATRPEHASRSDALHQASRLDDLLDVLTSEVRQRGPVRRLQTLLDGTVVQLMDIQELLQDEAKGLQLSAKHLKDKFEELNTWLDRYIGTIDELIEGRASEVLRPLRDSVSAFIDENIERDDIEARWDRRVELEGIDQQMADFRKQLLDEIREHLEEFNREVAGDWELKEAIRTKMQGPEQYDPWDIKRTLRWVSTGLSAVAQLGALIFTRTFWNPVGWIAGAVALLAHGLSTLIEDRETKLQHHKKRATEQLRKQIDLMEQRIVEETKDWFYKSTRKLVRGIQEDTRQLYCGMFDLSRDIKEVAFTCAEEKVQPLNRRLLFRCGELVGENVTKDAISTIARDPGIKTKFIWTDSAASSSFCKEVSRALGEWIEGVEPASRSKMIATALYPASIDPEKVSFDHDCKKVVVQVSADQVGRAIGREGSNVKLASRLMKTWIELQEGE